MRNGVCLSPSCLLFGAEYAEKQPVLHHLLLRNSVEQLRNGNWEQCETLGETGVPGGCSIQSKTSGKGESKLGGKE